MGKGLVAACPFPNFGKLGKHAPAVATPLGNSPVFGAEEAKGNRDDKSVSVH